VPTKNVMKLKVGLVVLFVCGFAASFAMATPPPGHGKSGSGSGSTASTAPTTAPTKGKPPRTGPDCRPRVSFVLKGTFVSGSDTSFVMSVTRANHHAAGLVGKDVTLLTDAKTKVVRKGKAKLTDLVKDDRLNVRARGCKDTDPATSELTAERVVAHPARTEAPPTTTTTSSKPEK
jgi:hypothetical protein